MCRRTISFCSVSAHCVSFLVPAAFAMLLGWCCYVTLRICFSSVGCLVVVGLRFLFFLSFFFFTFPLSFSLQFSRESENVSTAMEYYYSRPHSMLNGKKDEEQKRNHRKQPQSWKIWTKWLRYRYSRLKSK